MSIKELLNIPKGYKIKDIKYTDKEININIEPYKNKKAICSGCGEIHTEGYYGSIEVKVRDLPVIDRVVYLHVIKRRYKCPIDGVVYVEEIDWAKKKGDIPIDYLKKYIV